MKIMTMGCGERFSEETLGFASNSTIASGQSFKDGEMARIFNTLVYGWHALDPRELDLACPGADGAGPGGDQPRARAVSDSEAQRSLSLHGSARTGLGLFSF